MRNAALLAAVVLAASFMTTTTNAAGKKADPVAAAHQNHVKFMTDAFNPYAATAKPAKGKKKRG